MMSSGGVQDGRRSNYKDKIRAARERVNAVAAEREKLVTAQKSRSRFGARNGYSEQDSATQEQHNAVGLNSGRPQELRSSQAVQVDVTHDQMNEQAGAPPRPYRPERNSWFSIGVAPGQVIQSRSAPTGHQSRRNDHPSYIKTDSIYSQPGAVGEHSVSLLTTPFYEHQRPEDSSIGGTSNIPVPGYTEDVPTAYQPPSTLSVRTRNIPPPTRRGTESYYSHRSFISPIAEESPQSVRQSIQTISERSLDPTRGMDNHTFLEDSDNEMPHSDLASGEVSPIPVRQASVGRAAKPSVTVVRSRSGNRSQIHSRKISGLSEGESVNARQSAARASSNLGLGVVGEGPNEGEKPPLPRGAASISESNPSIHASHSHQALAMDPVVEEILGGLQKGGALPVDQGQSSSELNGQNPTISPYQERISTTSLTDLIKRATKVRTNLDKGRTASRIGLNDFLNRSKERLGQYEQSPKEQHGWQDGGKGFLMDDQHKYQSDGYFPGNHYNPGHDESNNERSRNSQHQKKTSKRRCCGVPQWLFVIILLLIIVCIAAAIIIPVELVVVPRQTAAASNTVDLSTCPTSHPCQNGGSSVVFNSTCSCGCVNGFTGTNCQTASDGACAMDTGGLQSQLQGKFTLGFAIPRFIEGSQSNFSVNLNTTGLAGAFSMAGLSCADQNSLVAFQRAHRKRAIEELLLGDATTGIPAAIQTPEFSMRQQETLVKELRRDITSDNIVLAESTTLASTAAAPSATVNGTSSGSASPTSTALSEKYYDFSGVAVLWILQNSNVQTAETAHSKLGQVLSAQIFNPIVINVGNGVIVDLVAGTVTAPGMKAGTGKGI